MAFWEKHLGVSPPQQPQPPRAPWWQEQPPPQQPQYQAPPQQQQQGLYGPQAAPDPFEGLAVDRPQQNAGDQQMIAQIQGRGFIRKPPSWVRTQPTDRCPMCDSATYAAIGSQSYNSQVTVGGGMLDGRQVPLQSFRYFRCFACGHSSTGVERQGVGGSGTVAPSRQTGHGGANLKNFGFFDPNDMH